MKALKRNLISLTATTLLTLGLTSLGLAKENTYNLSFSGPPGSIELQVKPHDDGTLSFIYTIRALYVSDGQFPMKVAIVNCLGSGQAFVAGTSIDQPYKLACIFTSPDDSEGTNGKLIWHGKHEKGYFQGSTIGDGVYQGYKDTTKSSCEPFAPALRMSLCHGKGIIESMHK